MPIRISYAEDFENVFEASEALRSRLVALLLPAAILIGIGSGMFQGLYQHDPNWWKPLPLMIPFMSIFWFLFCSRAGRRLLARSNIRKTITNPPTQVVWE